MTTVRRPIEDVLEDVGSVSEVLERHGFDSDKRHLRCPSPEHDDRQPGSVSILPPGTQGRERIYCHACGLNEDAIGLAQLLGERVPFTEYVTPSPGAPRKMRLGEWTKPKTRKQRIAITRMTSELENDPTVETDWIVAKKLAELGNRRAVQQEINRNWDYLQAECNVPRVYELVKKIWERGAETHGLPTSDTPDGWKRWVDKVTKEFA